MTYLTYPFIVTGEPMVPFPLASLVKLTLLCGLTMTYPLTVTGLAHGLMPHIDLDLVLSFVFNLLDTHLL